MEHGALSPVVGLIKVDVCCQPHCVWACHALAGLFAAGIESARMCLPA